MEQRCRPMGSHILLGLVLITLCAVASGHQRLVCPPPRSPGVGLKTYPCGNDGDASQPAFVLQPGPNTIVWEEAVAHWHSPTRFALSQDGADLGFETYVL